MNTIIPKDDSELILKLLYAGIIFGIIGLGINIYGIYLSKEDR